MKNSDERSVWVPNRVKRGCIPLKTNTLHNKILSHYMYNVANFVPIQPIFYAFCV